MNKALVTLGVLLIAVLAVLFAVPALIDWSRYRSTFEEEASRLIGRTVRVGDKVQLRLLPTPYISFDNVRVADASGRFDTPLVRMESFRLQLAVGSLLSGHIVAQDVELSAPVVRLAIGPDGRGNWAGLWPKSRGADGSEGSGLALGSVHVSRGSIDFVGTAPGQQWRLENVNGDIDAAGPEGPYRFKGQFARDGAVVDLRVTAGHDDATGKLRIKAVARETDTASADFTFDGILEGLDAKPSMSGMLEAKLPFKPAKDASTDKTPAPRGFDFKAKLIATIDRAKLDEMEFAVDSAGRPQRLTGNATLGFTGVTPSKVELKSTWLDFDQLAGSDAAVKPKPLQSLRAVLGLVSGFPGLAGDTGLHLEIEEAQIGGAPASAITLVAQKTPQGLHIERLKAQLPGQSMLELSGDSNDPGLANFDGQVRLWGSNLAAAGNWFEPTLQMTASGRTNAFLIDAAISADAQRFQADRLRAEISGTTVTGKVRYAAGDPASLSVALDSDKLDLAGQFESPINLASLAGLVGTNDETQAAPAEQDRWSLRSLLAGDAHLDLRIGRLITAQGALHDVAAKLDRSNGRLNIPTIDVATDEGFSLHVEGVLQVKEGEGQGQLRLLLAAPTAEAAASAARMAGLSDSLTSVHLPLTAVTPLALAGTIELGEKSTTSEGIALDGSAAGNHVSLNVRRDGAANDWLSGQIEAALDVANPQSERLIEQLAKAIGSTVTRPLAAAATATGAPGAIAPPGKLALRLSGIPQDGLSTRLNLSSGDGTLTFEGRTSVGPANAVIADGSLSVDAADANTLLEMTGLNRLVPDQTGALKFSARMHRDAATLALTEAKATIAGDSLSGEARLIAAVPLPRFEATVQTSSFAADRWLARLAVAPRQGTGPTSDATSVGTAADFWPERSLDLAPTSGFESKLKLSASNLVLARGIVVGDAKLSVESRPGRFEATLESGKSLEGDWNGKASLEKAAAGATLHLEASLSKARLDQLGSATAGLPRPEGELALNLSLDSTGLTPRDLAGSAKGKGGFSLTEGTISGFSSNSIDAAARELLAGPAMPIDEPLSRRLVSFSRAGSFAFLGAKGSLAIADGAIRFDKLRIDSSQALLEVSNRIDLIKLQLASSWRLQPKAMPDRKPPLPAAVLSFAGPLAELGALQPAVDSADLKRDLEIRRLLGAPEQLQGIWPSELAPETSEADLTPAVPAPAPAAMEAAKEATPPPSPEATGMAAAVLPGSGAAIAPADGSAAPASNTDPAAKRVQIMRPKKKKVGWATALFQDLFGN